MAAGKRRGMGEGTCREQSNTFVLHACDERHAAARLEALKAQRASGAAARLLHRAGPRTGKRQAAHLLVRLGEGSADLTSAGSLGGSKWQPYAPAEE